MSSATYQLADTQAHSSGPEHVRDPQASKKANLAGPSVGNDADLETLLPRDHNSLLTPKETQKALSPGDYQQPDSAFDRRRDWAVATLFHEPGHHVHYAVGLEY